MTERIRQVGRAGDSDHREARQRTRPGRADDPAPGHRPHSGAGAGPRRSAAPARSDRQDRQARVPPGRHVESPQDALRAARRRIPKCCTKAREIQRCRFWCRSRCMVSGDDLTDAQPGFDQRTGEPIVSFRFNTAGARRFAQVTQENVGRPFAIVLDNEVISAPVIREPILGGSGQISGNFTVESANDLAILLRAGALPAKLTPIEQRVVGAGPRPGLDREGQARILRGRRAGRRVHVRDLRPVRPVRQHRGRGQRGDDLRRAVAAQRDADVCPASPASCSPSASRSTPTC